MDAARRELLKDLLEQADDLAPEERADFLEQVERDYPNYPGLADELAELLHDLDSADDFLVDLAEAVLPGPNNSAPPDDLAGTTIHQYLIQHKIGGGGMGVVYQALDTRLKRTVALKFLPSYLNLDPEVRKRFEHEAQTAAALNHPNIGTIYDIGESDDGRLYIAMAFYDGETLKKKIARGPLPIDEAVGYAVQMLEGLARAHEAEIVHRDIKPANVMVTTRGRVKVVDFGIAKAREVRLTKTGTTIGTIAYMSPEQSQGTDVDARSDLWSAGVVLYEMLTGQRPFRGDYNDAIIYSVRHEEPESLTELRAEVPGSLVAVVERLLQKDPADRYPDADEAAAALRAALHAPVEDPAAAPNPYYPRPALAVGLVAVLVVAVLGIWRLGDSEFTAPRALSAGLSLDPAFASTDLAVSENTIAVFPFHVFGSEEVDDLSEGMVFLLSPALDGAGPLTTVHEHTLLNSMGVDRAPVLDRAYARELATSLGAGRFVLGSVTQLGQQVTLNATLYNASAEEEERAEVVAVDLNGLPAAVDDLVIQLIGDAVDAQLGDLATTAYWMTDNRAAFKAYLRGEEGIRQGLWQTGGPVAAFREAVRLDSTFVRAWARLLPAGHRPNLQRRLETWPPGQQRAAAYVKRYRDRLSGRERRLADALMDDSSNFYVRLDTLRQIAIDNPTFSWAWYLYVRFLTIFGAYYGYPASDALPAIQHALWMDPNNPEMAIRSMVRAAKVRDFDLLDSLLVYAQSTTEEKDLIGRRILLAAGRGDQEAMDSLLAQGNDGDLRWTALEIALFLEDIALAQEIDAIPAFPTDHEQTMLHAGRTLYNTAQGRLRRADSLRVADFDVQPRYLYTILALASPYYPAPANQLADMRIQIAQWDTTGNPLLMWGYPERNSRDIANEAKDYYAETIAFLKGLISFRQGDAAALAQDRAELLAIARQKGPESAGNFAHCLERVLTAMVLWKAKEYNEAHAVLDVSYTTYYPGVSDHPGLFTRWWFRNLTGSLRVFVRAEMLYEEGRYAKALRWYQALNDPGFAYPMEGLLFLGPSYLRRADIYEKLDQPEEAVEMYRRLVTLWQDADPELQPYVEEAQAHIERLSGAT